ncbi:MAG TPA: MBL fold metallo-hydrolase [Polyangiaceae bacterium]
MHPRSAAVALLFPVALALVGCEDGHLHHVSVSPPVPSAPAAEVFAGPRVTDRFPTDDGELSVVPLEHAGILFGWHDHAIYVDPTAPAVNDPQLPRPDAVLVTDPHSDHLDPVVLARLRRPGTVVVGPPSVEAYAPLDVALNNGDSHRVLDVDVTAVPSYNVSRGPVPGLVYHERGRDDGYLLDFGGLRVYVSGDTDCVPEVAALEHVDVAFVGMNVPYAMTPPEASACVAAFHPRVVIPYAYRHADLKTMNRAEMAPAHVVLRDFYPRAAQLRKEAYDGLAHGMWGLVEDRLDDAKRIDPGGESDWRVVLTRRWLKEYQNPWPW